MRKEAAQERRIIMIDVAQNLMSLGESIAAAHTASVNDNMIRSHYHDYYELYFLDNGERYHYIDDKLYKTEAGDCIIFHLRLCIVPTVNKDAHFQGLYFISDRT